MAWRVLVGEMKPDLACSSKSGGACVRLFGWAEATSGSGRLWLGFNA